jgi:hypothetical protein
MVVLLPWLWYQQPQRVPWVLLQLPLHPQVQCGL